MSKPEIALPPVPTNERITFLRDLHKNASTLTEGQTHRVIELVAGSTDELAQNDEREIMLASVSKIVYAWLYAQIVYTKLGLSSDSPQRQQLNYEQFKELLQRSPERVLTEQGDSRLQYAAFRSAVVSEASSGLNLLIKALKGELEGLTKQEKALIPTLLERFWSSVKEYLAQNKVEVSHEEFLYIVLGLSSNSSTVDAKKAVEDEFGLEGMVGLARALAPSFSPLLTFKDNRHYSQYAPNMGKLSEMVKVLREIVRSSLDKQAQDHEVSKAVVEAMTNSKEKFGFSFTESEYGQELIKRGYKIIEKTGYYPCVSWIEKIPGEQGIAYSMIVASAVCVISPDDQVYDFGGYELVEVKAPTKLVEDGIGGDGEKLYAYTAMGDDEYIDYVKPIGDNAKASLQEKLVIKGKELIS